MGKIFGVFLFVLGATVKDFDDFALQVRFLRLHYHNFFNTVLYESNHADYQGVA
jgi:hypothetical protein